MLMALEPADIQQVDTDEGKVSHIAQLYLFTHFPTRHLLRVSFVAGQACRVANGACQRPVLLLGCCRCHCRP